MNRRTRAAIQRIAPLIMDQLRTVKLEAKQLDDAVEDSSIHDEVYAMRLQLEATAQQASVVYGASMGGSDD